MAQRELWLEPDVHAAVYAVNDDDGWVWVLGIRRRPPDDYEDVEALIARLEKPQAIGGSTSRIGQ